MNAMTFLEQPQKGCFSLFAVALSNERSRRYVLSLLSDFLKRRTTSEAIATSFLSLYKKWSIFFVESALNKKQNL
jgi:hypothetical protein